jgi:septal ring-binding cell division protein DamX
MADTTDLPKVIEQDAAEKARENVEKAVIVLRPIHPIKRKVRLSRNAGKGKIHVQPPTEVKAAGGAESSLTVDQLFQSRVLAGAVWKSGSKNHKFTVQLMVLTAEDAEMNFKRMLSQDDYRRQATHFYIFKKNGAPEILFVFYGEYNTITEARKARNTIAPFLRVHKPYAISIKGAIAKVRK